MIGHQFGVAGNATSMQLYQTGGEADVVIDELIDEEEEDDDVDDEAAAANDDEENGADEDTYNDLLMLLRCKMKQALMKSGKKRALAPIVDDEEDSAYSSSSSVSSPPVDLSLHQQRAFISRAHGVSSTSGHIKLGYAGRSKHQVDENAVAANDNNQVASTYCLTGNADMPHLAPSSSSTRSGQLLRKEMNYGDDCAFVLGLRELDNKRAHYCVENNTLFVGIADGVSANRSRGYDPSAFPRALIQRCADYLEHEHERREHMTNNDNTNSNEYYNDNKDEDDDKDDDDDNESEDDEAVSYKKALDVNAVMLQSLILLYESASHAHAMVEQSLVYGSSTFCLMSLRFVTTTTTTSANQTRLLHHSILLNTCNLGDSGYMLIRDRRHVMYKSKAKTHRYNAPYQLGCTPPELIEHDLYRDK